MPRLSWLVTVAALCFVATNVQAQNHRENRREPVNSAISKKVGSDLSWKVASFTDAGVSPEYGAWIAKTIPEVVQPGTWTQDGGDGRLCYNAAENVLVVYHTPSVHAQIESLVTLLAKNQTIAKPMARPVPIVRTEAGTEESSDRQSAMPTLLASGLGLTVPPPPPPPTVGVPAKPALPARLAQASVNFQPPSAKSPRHLIHFILDGLTYDLGKNDDSSGQLKINNFTIRYEGEGFIDSNIVNFARAFAGNAGANVAQNLLRTDSADLPPGLTGTEENSSPLPSVFSPFTPSTVRVQGTQPQTHAIPSNLPTPAANAKPMPPVQ